MKRYTHCTFCKEEIVISSRAKNRPDLQIEKGDEFIVNCMQCGKTDKVHVNDVRAEPDKMVMVLGVLLGIVIFLFFFYLWGLLVGMLGFIISLLFINQEKKATTVFNSYLVRRK